MDVFSTVAESAKKRSPYVDLAPGHNVVQVPANMTWHLTEGKWLGKTPFIWSLPPFGVEVAVLAAPTQSWLETHVPFASRETQVRLNLDDSVPDTVEELIDAPFKGGIYGPFRFQPFCATKGVYDVLWYTDWPRWYDLERDVSRAALIRVSNDANPDIFTFAIGGLGVTKDVVWSECGVLPENWAIFRSGVPPDVALKTLSN